MTNRLAPIEAPYPDDVASTLAAYPQVNGYILSLFRTFANSKRFLKKGVPNLLDKESPLDLRSREIVILRVTANRGCEYEWGVHVAVFAKAAGFSEAQIAATCAPFADCWTRDEQLLVDVVDALCASAGLEEALLTAFQARWSHEEQLEILALCGTYTTISLVANVAQLPPENFAARFP